MQLFSTKLHHCPHLGFAISLYIINKNHTTILLLFKFASLRTKHTNRSHNLSYQFVFNLRRWTCRSYYRSLNESNHVKDIIKDLSSTIGMCQVYISLSVICWKLYELVQNKYIAHFFIKRTTSLVDLFFNSKILLNNAKVLRILLNQWRDSVRISFYGRFGSVENVV